MTVKAVAVTGKQKQSQLRLYLFDNPIIKLDFLRFRRRIANLFTKHGWLTLFFYVIVPVSISFFISRWLFPPPYDKWSFVIMHKTTGTFVLALWGTAAVIYYLFDCAVFAVNPLGLKARDPLIDDPPVVNDYEKMLFVARALRAIILFPLFYYLAIRFMFYDLEQFLAYGYGSGWLTAFLLVFLSTILAILHLQAIFWLIFLYTNQLVVRITAIGIVLSLTGLPLFIGSVNFNLYDFDTGKVFIHGLAWALHPFGTAIAFFNGIRITLDDVYGIGSLIVVITTIAFQTLLVYFAWRLVRIRFRKMILENYLQKAGRG